MAGKLLLLAGASKPDGWVTLDANEKYKADITATVPPLPRMVQDTCWDEIALYHGIEHLYEWEAQWLLHECRQCLAPSGRLVLEQPNILFAAQVLLRLREPLPGTMPGQCDMWPLYGDPTHRDPGYVHRWGWTPSTLATACLTAGFSRVEVLPATAHWPERDFRVEAWR